MTETYSHFVGIDWSGAKGRRQGGIAVALCAAGEGAPKLVEPLSGKRLWSRAECQGWIAAGCGLPKGSRVLAGLDSAFSMPFVDRARYLGADFTADSARALWQAVEAACSGADDLFGGPFVEGHSQYYHRPGHKGGLYERRMRVTEARAVESGAGPCESVFHLIGPSQVGLAGLSSMRMLAQLKPEFARRTHTCVHAVQKPEISVWPYEVTSDMQRDRAGVTLVEIYAAAFASLGGHRGKIRTAQALNKVLDALESKTLRIRNDMPNDHACDALVSAAALRHVAGVRKYWHPPGLSTMVRRTEGWVFGIL